MAAILNLRARSLHLGEGLYDLRNKVLLIPWSLLSGTLKLGGSSYRLETEFTGRPYFWHCLLLSLLCLSVVSTVAL